MKFNDETLTEGCGPSYLFLSTLGHASYFSTLHHNRTNIVSFLLEAFRKFSDVACTCCPSFWLRSNKGYTHSSSFIPKSGYPSTQQTVKHTHRVLQLTQAPFPLTSSVSTTWSKHTNYLHSITYLYPLTLNYRLVLHQNVLTIWMKNEFISTAHCRQLGGWETDRQAGKQVYWQARWQAFSNTWSAVVILWVQSRVFAQPQSAVSNSGFPSTAWITPK